MFYLHCKSLSVELTLSQLKFNWAKMNTEKLLYYRIRVNLILLYVNKSTQIIIAIIIVNKCNDLKKVKQT